MREAEGDAAAEALVAEFEAATHSHFAPWQAATQLFLHDVIQPEETRQAVIDGLFFGSGCR